MFTVGPPHTLSLLGISNGRVVNFTIVVLWRRIISKKAGPAEVITFLVTDVQGTVEFTFLIHLECLVTDKKLHFSTFVLSASLEHPLTLGSLRHLIHHRHLLPAEGSSCN